MKTHNVMVLALYESFHLSWDDMQVKIPDNNNNNKHLMALCLGLPR